MPKKQVSSTENYLEGKLLRDLYLTQNLAAGKIARKLKLSVRTLYSLFKLHGISKTKKLKQPDYCPTCGHIQKKTKRAAR